MHAPKYKYSYDKDKIILYEQNLSDCKNLSILCATLNKVDISVEAIDKCVGDLNEIMTDAAIKTFTRKRLNLKKKENKVKTHDMVY